MPTFNLNIDGLDPYREQDLLRPNVIREQGPAIDPLSNEMAHSQFLPTKQTPSSNGIDTADFEQNKNEMNNSSRGTICTPQKTVTRRKNHSDRHYKIEIILFQRLRGGQFEYLIKWGTYSDEHNTWAPHINLNKTALQSVKMLNIPLIE